MTYRKVLLSLLEEFEKGKEKLHIKGGRGYSAGSIYSGRNPPIYGESEAKREAREEEEKKKKRKYRLNKEQEKEVEVSKRFKEENFTLNELKQLIRRILNEKQ
jgi:hypothetical protein